ncbi:hypothetical protein [Glycomyces buryatensis]|uniref:Uncharacterized protein n=1 Tax=Glycomyces buryatensis TaxID=2570927 RepID=A0A4V4HSI7_9ACTN|nr:hypothetical protein [Glycomyces buryatensis]THV41856.1 hypothetical protein FAB82_09035 [Glycomyces buryatensis]
MSRTVGPYRDVATARVEGAYELCEGVDDSGHPVQILTLGSTSSKDPARRGLLSDTVAWAYATAGPDDAPILVADLDAEQPYVVVLRDTNLRGADRILDRLLSMGPATGPLPVGPAAAAQRAAAQAQQSAPPLSPTGPASAPPTPPPMSPQVVIAAPKKPSQLKPILIGVTSVVVAIAIAVGGWLIWTSLASDDSSGSLPASETSETAAAGGNEQAPEGVAEDAPEDEESPEWNENAASESVSGAKFADSREGEVQAYEGWPVAFRVPGGFTCDAMESSAVCAGPDGESTVTVGWEPCQGKCTDADRAMLREALPYQPLAEFGGNSGFAERTQVYGYWRASLSVFAETDERVVHVSATADVLTERTADAQKIINDVFNQAQSL